MPSQAFGHPFNRDNQKSDQMTVWMNSSRWLILGQFIFLFRIAGRTPVSWLGIRWEVMSLPKTNEASPRHQHHLGSNVWLRQGDGCRCVKFISMTPKSAFRFLDIKKHLPAGNTNNCMSILWSQDRRWRLNFGGVFAAHRISAGHSWHLWIHCAPPPKRSDREVDRYWLGGGCKGGNNSGRRHHQSHCPLLTVFAAPTEKKKKHGLVTITDILPWQKKKKSFLMPLTFICIF